MKVIFQNFLLCLAVTSFLIFDALRHVGLQKSSSAPAQMGPLPQADQTSQFGFSEKNFAPSTA